MAFEWQPLEQAAESLGVDLETLRGWIDQGAAPTRWQQGREEVLIEFPEEEGDEEAPPNHGEEAGEEPAADGSSGQGAGPGGPERVRVASADDAAGTELLPPRQWQIATGMVAGWQRLAERTGDDLARARRLAIVAWCLLGAIVVAAAGGAVWGSWRLANAEASLDRVRATLNERETALKRSRERAEELASKLTAVRGQLAEVGSQSEAIDELSRNLAQAESEARREVRQQLRDRIDRQQDKITALTAERDTARQRLAETEKRLAAAQKRAAELEQKRAQHQATLSDQRKALEKRDRKLAAAESELAACRKSLEDCRQNQAELEAARRTIELPPWMPTLSPDD